MKTNKIIGLSILALAVLIIGYAGYVNGFGEFASKIGGGIGMDKEWKNVDCLVTVKNPPAFASKIESAQCSSGQPITKLACKGTLSPLLFGIGDDDLTLKMYVGGAQAGATQAFTVAEFGDKAITYSGCVKTIHRQARFELSDMKEGVIDERIVDI